MLSLPAQTSVFAYTEPVNFRKQHDGLVALVRSKLKVDPLNGSLFLFFNRRRDRIKRLLWDHNGFRLFYKRLEKGTYEGPRRGHGAKLQLTRVELSMLLDGTALEKGEKLHHFTDVIRVEGRASEQAQTQTGELLNDVEALKERIAEFEAIVAAKDHAIALLTRIAFGKKSERRSRGLLPDDVIGQGHLFYADLVVEADRTALAKKVQGEIVISPPKRATQRKGRRARFPDHLPRVTTN